jgi:hypothetical protein
MHAKATFIFWLTLILYLVTLFTVTYVGVYLTYGAIPVLILSGLVMKFSTPKPKHKKIIDDSKSAINQLGKTTNDILGGANSLLDGFNKSLGEYNEINALVQERAVSYKNKIQALKLEKVPFEIKAKYAKNQSEKLDLEQKIKQINEQIESNKQSVEHICQACELEVKVK